jgi:hypothetical protein
LLIGREDLEGGEIEDGEIKEGEKDIGIANCEEFFLNYTNHCAISLHSANLIINRITAKIANTY